MRTLFQTMIEGATQAAALVPLLYVVPLAPAQAQLPRVAAAAASAPTLIEPVRVTGPLALRSRHMDVRIVGANAQVHTQLVYRNDTATAVKASYLLAGGARLVTAAEADGCGGDIEAEHAPFVESGEPRPQPLQNVDVDVAPGEEIVIEMQRDATVLVRGARHRMVLPVLGDDRAVFTPEFSATVEVVGDKPVTNLGSATHGGFITGIGERVASLEIANGRAYTSPFLAVEFELGGPIPEFVAANDEPMFQINARARR